MATLPENRSVAIDELESAITEMESYLESVRAERDAAEARQVELEIENANLRRELNLAHEQQKASTGILSVISSSVACPCPTMIAFTCAGSRPSAAKPGSSTTTQATNRVRLTAPPSYSLAFEFCNARQELGARAAP